MAHIKLDTLDVVQRHGTTRRSNSNSGRSSACSSGSLSPVPIIPIIAISRDTDDSDSESEVDAKPTRYFQRRLSTKRTKTQVRLSRFFFITLMFKVTYVVKKRKPNFDYDYAKKGIQFSML